jgi:hypothetical protein
MHVEFYSATTRSLSKVHKECVTTENVAMLEVCAAEMRKGGDDPCTSTRRSDQED